MEYINKKMQNTEKVETRGQRLIKANKTTSINLLLYTELMR